MRDFSTLVARLKKRISTSFTTAVITRKWGQILRQARAAGLKTQFMGAGRRGERLAV